MWQRIKQLPTAVKVAVVFLFILWSMLTLACPAIGIGLAVIAVAGWSLYTVINYWTD